MDEEGAWHCLRKETFQHLMRNEGEFYRLCPKLTELHLEAKGSERQVVVLAAQLLSHTVSKAIKLLGEGKMDVQSEKLSDFSNWFDTMNSRYS